MELNVEKIIRKYLRDVIQLSLATSNDGQPWVCDLIFAYDKDLNIYFRSLPQRRHSLEIAANPRVAGNIARPFRAGEFPLGIYFEGTAGVLPPGEEQTKAFQLFQDRLHVPDSYLEDAQDPDKHQFYKITVSKWHVFAKPQKDRTSGQKHSIDWNGDANVDDPADLYTTAA
jgi:uncharacterized protein YhbP (UPF0306 family)